jgi:hypothetical protein
MKIKFLSGPRAGQTTHVPNSQEYQVMASAGLIEIVPMAARGTAEWLRDMKERSEAFNPPVTVTVAWSVAKGDRNGRYFIAGKCSNPQCSELFYDGAPAAADKLTFIHSCSGTAPEKVPVAAVEKYRKLHFVPSTLGADEASYHFAARPQPSQVVDLSHLKGPQNGLTADPRHDNYGIGNYGASVDKPYDYTGTNKKK